MTYINRISNSYTNKVRLENAKRNAQPQFYANENSEKQVNELKEVTNDSAVRVPMSYVKLGEQKLPYGLNAHFYKLSNGQKVVILPKEGKTVLRSYVNTGSLNEPDNIICGCGERMHKFKTLERKNGLGADECPFSDWCEKSRLSTLYVVDEKCVCEFCYKICGYGDRGRELEKEKEMLQVCECEKLNEIKSHFPEGLAIDMESAAIAQTCYMYKIPFLSVRQISDTPGAENHAEQYATFWQNAPRNSVLFLQNLLSKID